MKVTCEIKDCSNPVQQSIRIRNAWNDSGKVELEVDGKRYTVAAEEIISAVRRATLDCFER